VDNRPIPIIGASLLQMMMMMVVVVKIEVQLWLSGWVMVTPSVVAQ